MPPTPAILDLGCGVGAQTLHLAELTAGSIRAIDSHAPSVERLRATIRERGLAPRVRAEVGDMTRLTPPPESFDLIWSEGVLYNLGIAKALRICHGWLRPGWCLAFTDAVWLKEAPPAPVQELFASEYPTMGRVADVLATVADHAFEVLGHFTLPDEAWWTDFYTPMEDRIRELRGRYTGDGEALAILDRLAEEPEMHRRSSSYYAYVFFVLRRPAVGAVPNIDPDLAEGPGGGL